MTVKWTGIRPLVMGNPQTVQVTNQYSVESRRLTAAMKAARKKPDEDKLMELEPLQRWNDFCGSAYWDKDGFFLPDTLIIACIKQAAQSLKRGRDVDRAVLMDETEARIDCGRRFKDLRAAFEDEAFRLECPCKLPPKTGTTVWKCRCMMPTGWKVQFNLTFDENLIAEKTIREINEIAGRLVGIGGWRPKFGRFTVEV